MKKFIWILLVLLFSVATVWAQTPSVTIGGGVKVGGVGTDSTAVHKTGDETIGGTKTFSDNLTLGIDPVSDMQAATKQYVDSKGSSTGELSLTSFGAKGGGYYYPAVSMTSGSNVVTFPGGILGVSIWTTGAHTITIGDEARVSGAGVAGADLTAHVTAIGANTITLNANAGTSVTNRGIIWGDKTDNSAEIQAAVDACYALNGCTLNVPPDFYGMSTKISLPANANSGRIRFQCGGGRQATWFAWTGAHLGTMFESPANSVPTTHEGCAFTSVDYNQRRAIAIAWLGGTEHAAIDNYFGDLYEGIRASMTWLNKIEFNRFYSCKAHAVVHFGPAGLGPVNGTVVRDNEFGCNGTYGLLNDSNGSGGSNGNTYDGNDFEGTTATTLSDVFLTETASVFTNNRFEVGGSTEPTYKSIRLAMGNSVISGPNITGAGMNLEGAYNTFISPTSGNVLDTGGQNIFIGPITVTGAGASSAVIYGGPPAPLTTETLTVVPKKLGGADDWASGKVAVAGTTFGSSTNAFSVNPTYPTDAGHASSSWPLGGILRNKSFTIGTVNGNALWVCIVNPCLVNNTANGQAGFARIEAYRKIRTEGTAAPSSGNWTVGDFFWNTNTTGANPTLGWVCTVAGTPGTWVAVTAGGTVFNPSLTVTDGTNTGTLVANGTIGFGFYYGGTNGVGFAMGASNVYPLNNTGTITSNVVTLGRTDLRWKDIFTNLFHSPTVTLETKASYTCDSTKRGDFNYIAGGAGVKDIVQVCGKDASDVYAWRPIY